MSLFTEDQSVVTFDSLVGDGKKYKTNEDVAKALIEKDRFIEQLKAENAEARQAATKPDRSQEILDQLAALSRRNDPVTTPPEPTRQPERTEITNAKSLTEEDILRVLQQREATARATNNVDKVKNDLKAKFGENYPQVLKSLQEKMGVTQDFLNNIAAQSPTAFMTLIGDTKPESVFTPPESSTSQQQTFKPTGGKAQPRSYYVNLKNNDRAKYFTPAVQNQMYKDAMELGEAFTDVDD